MIKQLKSKKVKTIFLGLAVLFAINGAEAVGLAAGKPLPAQPPVSTVNHTEDSKDKLNNQAAKVDSKKSTVVKVSSHPVLVWASYPDAVMYELDISLTPDFKEENIIFHSDSVYTFGYQPNLYQWLGATVFYRYRPLDYGRKPIDEWSAAKSVNIAYQENFPEFKPQTTANLSHVTPILYPVYAWIPVWGASGYKVEVYESEQPKNAAAVRQHKLLKTYEIDNGLVFDCYDEEARLGSFAWRVQALDYAGKPLGQFSDLEEFSLLAEPHQFALGVFGDSIMHGGGAISGSPADPCYSLHAYLKPQAVNLAKSGDTSAASRERFDKDVLPFAPRAMLILTGTNSIRGGESAQNVIADLAAINEKCKANAITPYFLTLPPINPARIKLVFNEDTAPYWQSEIKKVNQYIRQNLPHFDIAPMFTDNNGILPTKWSTDGLHPDGKAKKAIGEMVNKSGVFE